MQECRRCRLPIRCSHTEWIGDVPYCMLCYLKTPGMTVQKFAENARHIHQSYGMTFEQIVKNIDRYRWGGKFHDERLEAIS